MGLGRDDLDLPGLAFLVVAEGSFFGDLEWHEGRD